MASKLVSAEEMGLSQVSPLPWRHKNRKPAAQASPAHVSSTPGPGNVSPDEAPQLRAEIAQLKASAEQMDRKSRDAGYRAGELAARQAFEVEMRVCTEKLAQTIAELGSAREQTMCGAEADTVRLALEIARRVLHRELSVDPSSIEALVKAALEKLRSQEIYRVRVHPDQEPLVRRCLQQMGRGKEVEIVGDPNQAKGGALFEISRGTLDASVETQLREIERGLVDEMEIRK